MSDEFGDMRTAYGNALTELGQQDKNIVVLGADTTDSLKTSGFGKHFPDRFFNVGIAEANLVSVAAGLAYSGKTSFASTYAIFLSCSPNSVSAFPYAVRISPNSSVIDIQAPLLFVVIHLFSCL